MQDKPHHSKYGVDSLPLKQTISSFYVLLKLYWTKKESLICWIYLGLILLLTGGSVYIATRINTWYKEFWDTIQNYDVDGFFHQLSIFAILATIHVVVSVYNSFLRSKMAIEWRRYMTDVMVRKWLEKGSYYKMQLTDSKTDNPDQRIAEDLNLFVGNTIALLLGVGTDMAMLVSFSVVLWGLSQSVDLTVFGGYVITLPDGYLFYLAAIYAILGTIVTFILGKPLVRLNFRQQRYEADFRFSLIRLRESADSIALYKGESEENETLKDRFAILFKNYIQLINCTKRLGFLTLGYAQTAVIFPILIAAPIYFAKLITMGTIMQITSAFGRVHDSLSTLIMNFNALASWKSVIDRLSLFATSMDKAAALECIEVKTHDKNEVVIDSLCVKSVDERVLIDNLSLNLAGGDRLLIKGQSGCGKSTLMRTIAGIWPYATGSVAMTEHNDVLFLSQKPYLPQGSLRQCLYYPRPSAFDDDLIKEYMTRLKLDHLIDRLDSTEQWSHILSLGEMQRVAFIRALLNRPKVLFLDEASSALDEDLEALCYSLLIETLPQSIIISVGHRSSLEILHNKKLQLDNCKAVITNI